MTEFRSESSEGDDIERRQPKKETDDGWTSGPLEQSSDVSHELSDTQRAALADYTGLGHLELNHALGKGTLEQIEAIASRSTILSEALDRLPVHEGTVLRGSSTDLDSDEIARYVPGDVVVENRYLSTSANPEKEFGGNVLWVIEPKQGKDLGPHSVLAESEVLFDRFSQFEVLAKDFDAELARWVIYMQEV